MHLSPLLHWQEVAIAHIMFDYQSTILVSENEISNLKWAGGCVSRQGLCFMTEEDNKLHLSSEKGCQTGPDLSALENECSSEQDNRSHLYGTGHKRIVWFTFPYYYFLQGSTIPANIHYKTCPSLHNLTKLQDSFVFEQLNKMNNWT